MFSTEDRLHGSRSPVDARRLFLSPVITRYTHADSISTNSNAYLPIVFLAHTYGRDFACLRGVTRLCVTSPASMRGDRARLRKARGWLGDPWSRIYYPFVVQNYSMFRRVAFPREFADRFRRVARSCAKWNNSVYFKLFRDFL